MLLAPYGFLGTAQDLPVNLSAPIIIGWDDGGDIQVIASGIWMGADSVVGQWVRNGSDVIGETSSMYGGAFVQGDTIFFRETATNIYGDTVQNSNSITGDTSFEIADTVAMTWTPEGYFGTLRRQDLDDEVAMSFAVNGSLGTVRRQDLDDAVAMSWNMTGGIIIQTGAALNAMVLVAHRAWMANGYTNWTTSTGVVTTGYLTGWNSSAPGAHAMTWINATSLGTVVTPTATRRGFVSNNKPDLASHVTSRVGIVLAVKSNFGTGRIIMCSTGDYVSVNLQNNTILFTQISGAQMVFTLNRPVVQGDSQYAVLGIVIGDATGDVKIWHAGSICSATLGPSLARVGRTVSYLGPVGTTIGPDISDILIFDNPSDADMLSYTNTLDAHHYVP